MNCDPHFDLCRSLISGAVCGIQPLTEDKLCLNPLRTQSARTPFLESDIVFMKLLNLAVIDEFGIVQKEKRLKSCPYFNKGHVCYIQEFLNQKLDIRKLEDLSLHQFLEIIFEEIKLLSEETCDVFFSGGNAWEILRESGFLADTMQNLELVEARTVLQNNLAVPFISHNLEILVCIKDAANLGLLKKGIFYQVNCRECEESSGNPFLFSCTSFDKCLQTLSIPLKTENGSLIKLKIISSDQLYKETAETYSIKHFLNADADEYPLKFISDNPWQILINRLIGVPTTNSEQSMDFIMDLTKGRRPLDSNLKKVKVASPIFQNISEACETKPPENINALYAITFQVCALNQPSKEDCRSIWKATEQLSAKLHFKQKQNDLSDIFVLVKDLILEHNLPFNYILALFTAAGYIHQYTNQPDLESNMAVSFALTGDDMGVLLQIHFDRDAEEPFCYVSVRFDLVWAVHEICQGPKKLSESAQKSLNTFYELLLPSHPVKQKTDLPALQWISKGSIDLDDKSNQMLDEDQGWPIIHLGFILRCVDNVQKTDISSFCRMLEYLPKLMSKQMTEISRRFLLKSLDQLIDKFSLPVELHQESLVIDAKNVQKTPLYFFKCIVNCFSQCNETHILLTFKKMWIKEISRDNLLDKEMENLGIQILYSLISAALTSEAINLYLHLGRNGKMNYQISINILTALCSSVQAISATVNTTIYCIKLGECIKLLLKSVQSKGDRIQIPKNVSWVISMLTKTNQIPLVNEILNYSKTNENIGIEDQESLKAEVLRFNCKTSMNEETVENFLSVHQAEGIKEGELWLAVLNFVEKLNDKARKTLINSWVKAELNNSIIYSSLQQRKKCWMIALNSLEDIPNPTIVELYKNLGKVIEAFEDSDNQILQLVKATISILYQKLPAKPEQGTLDSLLVERDLFSSLERKAYFNEIDRPLIVLLCHSDSHELQLKGLNFFMDWVRNKNISDLYQAFSDTILELFPGIMQAKNNVEELHSKLLNITALLRTKAGSKLAHFTCAEKCIALSSPEAHEEAAALVLEGLSKYQLSPKLVKFNQTDNDEQVLSTFKFNKIVNDKHLHATLYLLLVKVPKIVHPDLMIVLLNHDKTPYLINSKSLYLLWSKFFTQLNLILDSPDCSAETQFKWYEFLLKNLTRIEIDQELVKKHFECNMDRIFSNFLKIDVNLFTKTLAITTNIFTTDIDECRNSDSNNRRISFYLPLYVQLFKRCLKALNEAVESDHIECLYHACEHMMYKTVELSAFPLFFKFVEIPYQQFLSWGPKKGHSEIFQEHISTVLSICKTALKNNLFQKKQWLAQKLIPDVFEQMFNFISLYPYKNEDIHNWYVESKDIIYFLLGNKVITGQCLEKIMSKLILFAPLSYGIDIYKKENDKLNWLSDALKVFFKKNFLSISDGKIFILYLTTVFLEEMPLKYENIKDTRIGLFDKCSSYPNYNLVIRCTILLSRFQSDLQPKDFATCLDKLQSGVMHLPNNIKTYSLLIDLCKSTYPLIFKYPTEINYKHPHNLIFALIKRQLNILNDQFDSSISLTPKRIVEDVLDYLADICDKGVYSNNWSDLYAILQLIRNVVNRQDQIHLFTLNLVGFMLKCCSRHLTNPQEQLQRAEFFVQCLEDVSSSYSIPTAVSLAASRAEKETQIFCDHQYLLDKYKNGKKTD